MKSIDLISDFKDFYRRKVPYVKDAATENAMDCSGAFVVAFKRHGQYIFHGSNTIVRKYILGTPLPISQAKPGYAIFKWQEANDEMPSQYRYDGLGDFYHIGLLGEDGVSVYNAKGTKYGFCIDPLSKWQYAAPLKGVQYEEMIQMEPIGTAIVATESTSLNLRSAPSTDASIVAKIPKGSIVTVYQEDCATSNGHNWSYISTGSFTGYVSQDYLRFILLDNGQTENDIFDSAPTGIKITDSEGNVFYPIGNFTVEVVTSID